MVAAESPGSRLKLGLRAAGLSQDAAAARVGVSRKTVYRWTSGLDPIPEERYATLAKLIRRSESWLRTGEEAPRNEPGEYGAPVRKFGGVRESPGLTYRVRVFLHEFLADLARLGGTEEEIARARDLLTRPELMTWYVEGYPAEFDEEQVLQGMQAIAKFIEMEVKRRARGRGKS